MNNIINQFVMGLSSIRITFLVKHTVGSGFYVMMGMMVA
jgi:hypothetical protein